MQIEVLDHLPSELDRLAQDSTLATFYQTRVWLESLDRAFPAMRLRVMVAMEAGAVTGYLPFFEIHHGPAKRLWSLPFGTYGGPVTEAGSKPAQELVRALMAMRRQRGVHEIGLVDFSGRQSAPALQRCEEATHLLDLVPGFEKLWADRFDRSKRRQTRRAEREGLRITQAESVEELKRYYRIYQQRSAVWRQRIRYPEELFVDLFEKGGESVKLFLAWQDDTLLGGHLNFYFKNTVIAWNGVTTASSRGTQAGTLLYAACIRHACDNGYRDYNLGGSLGSESLAEYKEALGASLYGYATLRWRSPGARIASVVMKYLPKRQFS